ncbi:response regulator transcription factor [Eleftheria terrae]|uniref:response regulator transcription factor n=1 Tax=Eleftheria terrae TaxID=1597781 RepID=UPI00263A4AB8|nr:response regulator [Eleftheria terrae]WKB55750.1 response regulator [Eleftheria terrae]
MAIVHVIDDDAPLRNALERLLSAAGYEVRTYLAAGDYLVAPPPLARPACLLLDLQLPGVSGLELQAALSRHPGHDHPVVFISGTADVRSSVQAMRAGASHFLTKPIDGDRLLAAIKDAVELDMTLHERHAREHQLQQALRSLTPRERQVLDGVCAGRLHKQMAAELGVSERTIKSDRARIMRALGVTALPDLMKLLVAPRPRPGSRP